MATVYFLLAVVLATLALFYLMGQKRQEREQSIKM